jgi:hypothetical protein
LLQVPPVLLHSDSSHEHSAALLVDGAADDGAARKKVNIFTWSPSCNVCSTGCCVVLHISFVVINNDHSLWVWMNGHHQLQPSMK